MSVALQNLIQTEADLGSESDDEDFDEETGEVRHKTNGTGNHFDDSSEEEEEDDEEEERAVSIASAHPRFFFWARMLTCSQILD